MGGKKLGEYVAAGITTRKQAQALAKLHLQNNPLITINPGSNPGSEHAAAVQKQVSKALKGSMSIPSNLLLPKSAGKVDGSKLVGATISQHRLDQGSIVAPKIQLEPKATNWASNSMGMAAGEKGTLPTNWGDKSPSGVFINDTPIEAFASVESSLSDIMGKMQEKQEAGMPTFVTTTVGKSYEEYLTQEAIDKAAEAFKDLHQVIGKASPKKPHKGGSAMALLSKKTPPCT